MKNEAVRTEKVGRFTVEVHYDEDAESPREWDNLGTIAAWHRRYDLGDKNSTRGLDPQEFQEWLEANPGVIYLPVFMYDHSGIALSTGRSYPFNCPWDSGQLGVIYATPEKLRKEYGETWDREVVLKVLRQEIETYSAFVEGRNFGFVVKDEDGEHVDSCWGFIGEDDYALAQGKESAQHLEDKAVKS